MARPLIAIVWVFGVGCLFAAPGTTLVQLGRATFWVMLVVHSIECLAFLPRLRGAPGSLAGHLGQTLLFGYFHLRSLPSPEAG